LLESLNTLLQRPVDLVVATAITNPCLLRVAVARQCDIMGGVAEAR